MRLFGGNIQSCSFRRRIAKLIQYWLTVCFNNVHSIQIHLLRKLSSLTYILTSSSFCSSCWAEITLLLCQTGKKLNFVEKRKFWTRGISFIMFTSTSCFTVLKHQKISSPFSTCNEAGLHTNIKGPKNLLSEFQEIK